MYKSKECSIYMVNVLWKTCLAWVESNVGCTENGFFSCSKPKLFTFSFFVFPFSFFSFPLPSFLFSSYLLFFLTLLVCFFFFSPKDLQTTFTVGIYSLENSHNWFNMQNASEILSVINVRWGMSFMEFFLVMPCSLFNGS